MSKRPRKRHVQQSMVFRTWGGKREGAGRPKKGYRASERHTKRPSFPGRFPLHAIPRVEDEIRDLRKRTAYHAFRAALEAAGRREDFRIVYISLQRGHVHLVVEASDERALARGMQGFEISAAHRVNAAISVGQRARRHGRVFADRYHARILRTPREVRHVLNYVINNWRHHGEDQGMESRFWQVDPYSSGPTFTGWNEPIEPFPDGYSPLETRAATTWLLRVGWLHGGRLSPRSVPGRECDEG